MGGPSARSRTADLLRRVAGLSSLSGLALLILEATRNWYATSYRELQRDGVGRLSGARGELLLDRDPGIWRFVLLTDRENLLHEVARIAAGRARVIVGLAGPPAAGKSTLAEWLMHQGIGRGILRSCAYLPLDGFHLSNRQLERLGRTLTKGGPETYDIPGFMAILERLRRPKRGETVYAPSYSRSFHEPIAADIDIDSDVEVVVVEGNYLLLETSEWGQVARLLDAAWLLSSSWDVCRTRLIQRQRRGGRDEEGAINWVDRNDRANYENITQNSVSGNGFVKLAEVD
jgi:pantothenate kinase